MKKIIITLTAFLLLTSCGTPETAEAIATPAATTAATFGMSTTAITTKATVTTTTPTTTAPPETTTEATTTYPPKEVYAIDFPDEFYRDEFSQPPYLEVPDELYDVEISAEAEKLFDDYYAFAEDSVIGDSLDDEYPPYYEDGRFQMYPAGKTVYGLVDIDTDGTPEIFKYYTMGHQGSVKIYFYDMQTKEPLTEKNIYGFCRDGATYFGKNEKGNLMMCSGYLHSVHEGIIEINEMIYDKTAEVEKLIPGDDFAAGFEMVYGYLNCIGYEVNDFGISERDTGSYVPRADFEAAFREFYDAIDFDVYWICGDILYHGAEETEYKGKMAYEKYLEFTQNQAFREYIDEKTSYEDDNTKLLIDDINSDETNDVILIYSMDTTFAYFHNGEIKEIRAEQGWGDGMEGGGMPLYYNKKTDEFLTFSQASSYKNYSFYEFSHGEYKLKNEHIWRELIDVWDVDKWVGNTNQQNLDQLLELYNLTFEDLEKLDESELLGIAWTLGTFDRVNQYTIDEKEVTEAVWQKAIDDFINADDTILLCPDNTDLDFVDDEDGDFSRYVEEKLPNN